MEKSTQVSKDLSNVETAMLSRAIITGLLILEKQVSTQHEVTNARLNQIEARLTNIDGRIDMHEINIHGWDD